MLKFSVTFGVNPGYDTVRNAENENVAVQIAVDAWRNFMELERSESGIMVSGQLSLVRLVYPLAFGCPLAGEVAVEVSGRMNPEFDKYETLWTPAVVRICNGVKKSLGQERISITFERIERFIYSTPESLQSF